MHTKEREEAGRPCRGTNLRGLVDSCFASERKGTNFKKNKGLLSESQGLNLALTVFCRGTSLIRNSAPLGPNRRTMPRVPGWSWGGGAVLMSEVPLYSFDSGAQVTAVCRKVCCEKDGTMVRGDNCVP